MPKGYVRLVCDTCEGKLTRTRDGGLECKYCGVEYEKETTPDNREVIRFNVASPFSLSCSAFPGFLPGDKVWDGEGVAPTTAL